MPRVELGKDDDDDDVDVVFSVFPDRKKKAQVWISPGESSSLSLPQ
jgi:hypothetical protein